LCIYNKTDSGFSCSVYKKNILSSYAKQDLKPGREKIIVHYDDEVVRGFASDIIVEQTFIPELEISKKELNR